MCRGAEVLDGLGEHRVHLVFLADIALDGDSASTHGYNLMRNRLCALRVGHIVDDDVRTSLSKT
jgi:hypothetical protein